MSQRLVSTTCRDGGGKPATQMLEVETLWELLGPGASFQCGVKDEAFIDLAMKPEQTGQHLQALFQGWVTCPGPEAGQLQYSSPKTLAEKSRAASQIAPLQPSGPGLALGGGR